MRNTLTKLQNKPPKPEAIIFDWDNTLVNTWPVIHHALVETFIRMGAEPWSLEETKRKVGKSLRDHFPALFGDKWEEAGKIYTETYRANNLKTLEGLPEALDMLDYIGGLDLYRAVISNKQGPVLRTEAEHMGWAKYFHKIIGAHDAKRDKPFPDPVFLALEGSGIEPSEKVWFVGDTITDVETALVTGCTPIFYGDGKLPEDVADKVYYIDSHGHLRNLINEHHS